MKLAIIVAAAKNGVIGKNNQLPWHLPQDLKYFKSITLGKPVIMGRKTYESIGRPLPGRVNIVVTRDQSWQADSSVIVVNGLESAIVAARKAILDSATTISEAMIIGGAEIYRESLQWVDKIYLTEVDLEPEGDAFFSSLDGRIWEVKSSIAGDESVPVKHRFLIYQRVL